jgi:hypothetical protein
VQRNSQQASLPKGRLYLAFLVWTEAELEKHHSKMYTSENLANAHLSESYRELDQWQAAGATQPHNFIQKAVHYQAATKAHGQYVLHHRTSSFIWQMTPLESNLKRMDSGLLVLTKGSAWVENDSILGGKHALLGRALIRRKD